MNVNFVKISIFFCKRLSNNSVKQSILILNNLPAFEKGVFVCLDALNYRQ